MIHNPNQIKIVLKLSHNSFRQHNIPRIIQETAVSNYSSCLFRKDRNAMRETTRKELYVDEPAEGQKMFK
jgi:hypothetical protein